MGGAAPRDARAEEGRRRGHGQRRAVAQHEASAHHPGQRQARRRHTRNLHQLSRSPCLSCPLVRWGGTVTDLLRRYTLTFLGVFHFIIYCIVKSSLNWNRIRVTNKQGAKRGKKNILTQTHGLPPIRRVPGSASTPVPYGLNETKPEYRIIRTYLELSKKRPPKKNKI